METIDGKQPGVQVSERMARWIAKQSGGKELLKQTQHPEVQEDKEEKGELPQLLEAARGDIERINAGTVNPPVELHSMARDAQAKVIDDQDAEKGYEDDKEGQILVETESNPVGVLIPPEKPIEGEVDEQKRREMITQNLEFVLDTVPALARSNPVENDKYTKKIDKVKGELLGEGIDVDKYTWRFDSTGMDPSVRNAENGKRKKLLSNIVNYLRGDGKFIDLDPKHQKILDDVGIKPEDLVLIPEEERVIEVDLPPEKGAPVAAEPRGREAPVRPRRIESVADVEAEKARIAEILDPNFRSQQFAVLARKAFEIGASKDLVNELSTLSSISRLQKTAADVQKSNEVPELKEIVTDEQWISWGRKRLAMYLDPDSEQAKKFQGPSPFSVLRVTLMGGTNWADATFNMPPHVKEQLVRELETMSRLKPLFTMWLKNHEGLKKLTDEESAEMPSNEIVGKLLNDLNSENGVIGEGSKQISKAIAIYARMAPLKEGARSRLMSARGAKDGLNKDVPSIFNNLLSPQEIASIRGEIARACGGEYYETLGLILAKFMGIAARGSNSIKSQIVNSDCVGKLIYTKEWNLDGGERDRWLPNEMILAAKRKSMFSNEMVKIPVFTERDANYDSTGVPIRLAVDAFGLQTKAVPGERGYYLRRTSRGQVQIVKELPGEADTGLTLESFLTSGQLHKVDWKGSRFELITNLRNRIGKSLALYNLLREPMDTKAPSDPNVLREKRLAIENALVHYGNSTKNWVGFLYVNSWLLRHSRDWLKAHLTNKSEDVDKSVWPWLTMQNYIEIAQKKGLIDGYLTDKLKRFYIK